VKTRPIHKHMVIDFHTLQVLHSVHYIVLYYM